MVNPIAQPERTPAGPDGVTGARDPLSIPAEVKASIRILVVDDERTLRAATIGDAQQLRGFSPHLHGMRDAAVVGLDA